MNFRFLLMLFFLSALFSNGVLGQTGFRLNGTIRSAEDGETLPGVSISVPSMGLGASSNEYGFYSLLLPSGDSLDVVFSFVGYQTQTRRVRLAVDMRLDIQLVFGVELETIEVTAQGGREEVRNPQMSVEVIQAKEVKMIPVLLGESDILKSHPAETRDSFRARRGSLVCLSGEGVATRTCLSSTKQWCIIPITCSAFSARLIPMRLKT